MDTASKVRQVGFLRNKHGRELLVEAAWLSELTAFDCSPTPHALDFYDILLITAGSGTFGLDDKTYEVRPGVVFFTRPGQVRCWRVEGLDGACVFFTADFIREAFADVRFIDQFAYFRPGQSLGAKILSPEELARFLECFEAMRLEFAGLRGDASELLRAKLYELLVLLNRWWAGGAGRAVQSRPDKVVDAFMAMIERDYRLRLTLEDYAARLAISPGHLSVICKAQLGSSAATLIRQRTLLEAKRLLLYTDEAASAVAYALGFEDAAYFSRFFRRETGRAPQQFRAHRRHTAP